ncbi:MAG: hypothetical protein M2R45_02450 [Verrucomicrobia subdivision 3 bacterium]|nr:hypothetical protein [Limisphaerales bacterium]MCS1416345.1 hypothetical protein [Limisphaerales bacterium]
MLTAQTEVPGVIHSTYPVRLHCYAVIGDVISIIVGDSGMFLGIARSARHLLDASAHGHLSRRDSWRRHLWLVDHQKHFSQSAQIST